MNLLVEWEEVSPSTITVLFFLGVSNAGKMLFSSCCLHPVVALLMSDPLFLELYERAEASALNSMKNTTSLKSCIKPSGILLSSPLSSVLISTFEPLTGSVQYMNNSSSRIQNLSPVFVCYTSGTL